MKVISDRSKIVELFITELDDETISRKMKKVFIIILLIWQKEIN